MTEFLWDTPSSWQWTTIKELGYVVSGGTPSTKQREYWDGDVIWFAPSDLTGYKSSFIKRGAKTLTEEGLARSSAKLMPAGSVMFSSRAPVGYVAINSLPAATNQGFKSIVPYDGVINVFLYHYLKASKQLAESRATGTTFKELSGTAFSALPIPICPINEQRRIVERIDALFDEIDKGVEELCAAKATLDLYRQSLLRSAFEGQLTADWRARNSDSLEDQESLVDRTGAERDDWYRSATDEWKERVELWKVEGESGPKPRSPDKYKSSEAFTAVELSAMPDIPPSWIFLRLKDVAAISSGMSVSKARKFVDPVEVPYLRVANVQRGFLELGDLKEMQVERSQIASLCLAEWDVLFNEGGDRDKLGRGWIWECQVSECITQNHVFRASPFKHDKKWSEYISQWGNSFGRDYFEKGGKQTTNLASINKAVLMALPVPCCSSEEQAEVMRLLDTHLETADALGAEIDAALTRADVLRKSILKKAFSGQLVPQDPTDEPASVLLERIRAERAAAPKPKRKRKASA